MSILEILENKKESILNSDVVLFTAEELNIMCDPMQIRTLKLYAPMPDDFAKSGSIEQCISCIMEGDCIYRVLEYCILTNIALQSITKYVKRLA